MNSVHFLAIVSTPIYILPEIVRFPTVEDTSYNTFITAIPSLFLYHTLNPVQSFCSILPVEISPRVQGPGTLTLIISETWGLMLMFVSKASKYHTGLLMLEK